MSRARTTYDHLRLVVLATVLVASLVGPGAGAVAASTLQVVSEDALSDRLVEYVVESDAMEGEQRLRVLLPAGYATSGRDDYPVLYLLHGCCDDFRSWSDKTDLEAFTADKELLVVMPDAGFSGFYSDWFNNGLGGPPRWQSYHIEELIPWVEQTFRVRSSRDGRILAGLSMGGFGSFSYAARHPDLFVSAAAYSPAVDTNLWEPAGPLVLEGIGLADGTVPGSIWGQRALEQVRWRGANPWDLAANLGTLDLWLITGNGYDENGVLVDPIEAFVHDQAVNVHDRLDELGIEHYWEDYGPGTHSWELWERDLHLTLPQQLALAESRPPDPTTFTFRSIDPAYEVFRWDVEVDRDVLEFSRLAVTDDGFTLEGSGTAAVTTPPRLFPPGRDIDVEIDGEGTTLTADRSGRLSVPVDLGPSNNLQQYRMPGTTTMHTMSVTWMGPSRPGRGAPAPAPPSPAGPAPAPLPAPDAPTSAPAAGAPLPSTGGGIAAIAVLLVAAAGTSRRRSRS